MNERGYRWQLGTRRRLSRRRLIAGSALAAGSAALLAACGSSKKAASPSATSSSGGGTPKSGGRLLLAYTSSTTSLNPVTDSGQRLALNAYQAFDRLISTRLDLLEKPLDQEYQLEAAQSVELPDPTTVTFKLKPGLKYQNIPPVNGRPVVADDIVQYQQYVRDNPKAGNNSFQLVSMKSVEAPDDQTVVFKLNAPDAYLFSGTQLCDPGAQCIVPKELLSNLDTAWTVGSGPYQLADYQMNVRYLYRRFDGYHEASRGLPYIQERQFTVIQDSAAQESAFRSGQIEIWLLPITSLADQLKRDMGARIAVDSWLQLSFMGLFFNVNRPPWNDVRVREAMYRVVNRQQYLNLIEQGKGKVPPGPMPAGLAAYQLDASQTEKYFHQDPKQAKQLLDAAGFPYDKPVQMICINRAGDNQACQIFQEQVAPLGIKVQITPLGIAEYLGQHISTGNWEVFADYFPGYDTPNTPLRLQATNTGNVHKYAGLKDPAIDKMIEQSEVAVDKNENIKLVKQIQLALLDKYTPEIYLENPMAFQARYAYVHNWQTNPATEPMYQLEAWLDK